MPRLNVRLFSGEKVLLDDQADSVVAPGEKGYFGILPMHTDFISVLKPGILRIGQENKELRYSVQTGFLEVSSNQVRVFGELSEAVK